MLMSRAAQCVLGRVPVCSALLVALCCACAPAQSARLHGLSRVQQHGVLRWGADIQGGEPYLFEDPAQAGHLVGFEVEIADAIARELGVRAEFVQNDWSTLVPSLERGTFDVILNGLEATPARRERIALSRPYYVFQEVLSARIGDARVRDLTSVRGLRVGTLASSLAWDMLDVTGASRVPYEGVEEPYLDLMHGRIDAVLLDDVVADRYGKKPGLHEVAQAGTGEYVVGVQRSEPDLLNAVDRALTRIERSGELQAILTRWQLKPDSGHIAAGRAPLAAARAPEHASFTLGSHQLLLFFQGAWATIAISMVAMVFAVLLGMLLALARLPSPYALRRALAIAATVYVEVFRGTPVLLQLYVLYYGLASVISLDAFTAAALGLGLNYAAYEAEIYRAGIQAVPAGEVEAARAMGMSGALTLRRVVLPHAARFSLPGVANDFISLLKDSSLVSVITVVELTKRMTIAAVDGRSWVIPGLLCAALYLVMSYPLSLLARRFEHHLGGHKR
ncbi:MAG TPA: ABC transporter substrate-binding protein/permease [Polyangiales bacterium]|nr:ABC transporter substrate-binding protein/permease [Polyangiales bacterium]